MHVVVLAEFAAASGGAEKVALESARGLAEAGATVTYIHAVAGAADPLLAHPRLRRLCLDLSDIWTLPAWQAAAAGLWHAEAARRLAAVLDGLPAFDCLHLHQWTRALSPAILPVLHGQGVPVVATLHDYALACPNGVYHRFDRDEPCTLKPLSAACLAAPCDPKSAAHKLIRVGRSLAQRIAWGGQTLHVVHVSDASLTRLAGLLAGRPVVHHRIDNPVRVARGVPAAPAENACIAYVGRLTREKGADLVAAAAAAAGLPALFVGDGPLAESLRAQPGAEVLGWRSPAAVEALLRARARAVCAPSRWYETGPLAVYEALAMGLPAVVSDRAGAGEKVVDGLDGLRVAPQIAPLTEAFGRLREDEGVARMGRAAHARYWAAPMTPEAHAAALLVLYEALCRTAHVPAGGAAATAGALRGAAQI